MIFRRKQAAVYPLNARTSDGQRVETDTIADATYTIEQGGDELITKTLAGGGLEIRHSDNLGDGYLYVIIGNNEILFSGKALQRLSITCCDGSIYPAALRPEFIYIED